MFLGLLLYYQGFCLMKITGDLHGGCLIADLTDVTNYTEK
jgi:hypothetical protein